MSGTLLHDYFSNFLIVFQEIEKKPISRKIATKYELRRNNYHAPVVLNEIDFVHFIPK